MAFTDFYQALGDKNYRAMLAQRICKEHSIDPARITELHWQQNVYSQTYEFMLELKPMAVPAEFARAVAAMRAITTDEFRQDILAAAVPDLYKAQKEVLKQFEFLANPQRLNLSEHYIRNLLGKIDGKSHNLGISRPPLRDTGRRADSYSFPDLPTIHP